MDAKFFEHIQENLIAKRQSLVTWLRSTPIEKKIVRLGSANEQAVQAHVHVLDNALEKIATQTLGQCIVCHQYIETALLEKDYTACVCIEHLSVNEIRDLESELELSQVVQQALLPQQMPEIPGLDLAAYSRPAHIIGGDYYDFFRFRNSAYGLAIGDVAGHGVSASLLMASVQAILHTLIPMCDSPADVLRQVNRLFLHNIHYTTFVTLFLGAFDPATSTLIYCSAGHNPPLLFHRHAPGSESVAWLKPTGAAIGLIEEFQMTTKTVTLSPGDILLLYTDGVTEALNLQGEEIGQERLVTLIRQKSHLSATDLVRALRRMLQEFSSDQPLVDDTTIVVCKIAG
jgi:sigma-B regulation protein RsbU (phosphoserine phosphatase)